MVLWSSPSPSSADAHTEPGRHGAGPWVWQLWIVVPLLVLATAALSTWMVMRANQAAAIAQMQTQQLEETELIARLIGSKLEQSQKVLATVAEAAAPWALDSKPTLEWLIDQGLPATRYFDSLVFARGSRVFRLNFRTGVEGNSEVEPAERDLLRRIMVDGKLQVSEPMKNAVGGPGIAFGMPLRDKSGDVQGAMAGVLRLQSQSLLPASLAGQSFGSQLVVMTAGGVVISHPDPARILGQADDEPALAQALQLWRDRPAAASKTGALAQWSAPTLISVADIPSARWLVVRVVERAHMLPLATQLTLMRAQITQSH
ncbi:MAG: cache domain-containing protein, partial [Comamonas sp.]